MHDDRRGSDEKRIACQDDICPSLSGHIIHRSKAFAPHDDMMTHGRFLKKLHVTRQMPGQTAIFADHPVAAHGNYSTYDMIIDFLLSFCQCISCAISRLYTVCSAVYDFGGWIRSASSILVSIAFAFDDLTAQIFFHHQTSNRRSKASATSCIFNIYGNRNFRLIPWSKTKEYRVILSMRIF